MRCSVSNASLLLWNHHAIDHLIFNVKGIPAYDGLIRQGNRDADAQVSPVRISYHQRLDNVCIQSANVHLHFERLYGARYIPRFHGRRVNPMHGYQRSRNHRHHIEPSFLTRLTI